jgi:cardiolipin synthase
MVSEGVRAIEPVVEEIVLGAASEIQILAYLFTTQANRMLRLIEGAGERGVTITIVVNDLERQNEQVKLHLRALKKKLPRMSLVDFHHRENRQLHAKVVVADRKRAVVGSANLSLGGMVTNYEVGVLLQGEPAWQLAKVIDRLVLLAK